jgi:hypothetical protein
MFAKKSTAMTPPDLVRQIDAPSRGSERRSTGLGAKMDDLDYAVGRLSAAALDTRGSARVLA